MSFLSFVSSKSVTYETSGLPPGNRPLSHFASLDQDGREETMHETRSNFKLEQSSWADSQANEMRVEL